ncbi:MAG: hypothetical protein O7C75_08480 [Verrucomicrobia bacterium]|nr:hypothetical protein [Verrucomicrobiota bacterium]
MSRCSRSDHLSLWETQLLEGRRVPFDRAVFRNTIRQTRLPSPPKGCAKTSALTSHLVFLKQPDDYSFQLTKRPEVFLNVDLMQMGVGGSNSWSQDADPLKDYCVPSGQVSFSFRMMPLAKL